MRFKTGDRVEVMNDDEVPISWHTAVILSSSGNTYTVQYEFSGVMSGRVRKTVLTNSVRPCPPILQGAESFSAGDTVEIFYEYSWKVAAILKILGSVKGNKRKKTYQRAATLRSRYLVRLLGCSQQLIIDGSNIRRRQTWHDGTWILMGKNFRAAGDALVAKVPTSSGYPKMKVLLGQSNSRAKTQAKDFAYTHGENAVPETTEMSFRSQKRMSPFGSSIVDLHFRHLKRLRAVETSGLKWRPNAAPVVHAKVYGIDYPGEILGEKNIHASVNIISNRYNQIEKNHVIGYSGFRSSELSSDDDATCSVGSCSVTSDGFKCSYRQPTHILCHTDALCSDAESFCGSESETESSSEPPKEGLEILCGQLTPETKRGCIEFLSINEFQYPAHCKELVAIWEACNRHSTDDSRGFGIELWTIQSSTFRHMLQFMVVPWYHLFSWCFICLNFKDKPEENAIKHPLLPPLLHLFMKCQQQIVY